MTAKVEVAGVGMHPFGRFPDLALKDLAGKAVLRALDDAGISARDIEIAYGANSLAGALSGQHQVRAQTVLREVGIEGVPVINVENACAGGSTALYEAVTAVRAGRVDVALAVGFEKMYVGDTPRTLSALQSAADLDVVSGLGLQFTAVYAMRLRKFIEQGHIQDRHLAEAAVKSHANGALNEYAQFRSPVTTEQVLASRPIAEPLTLLMCSSLSDGAAAAVVVRGGALDLAGSRRIRVRASALRSGVTGAGEEDSAAALCARMAYEEASLGPEDVDIAEVHDAMAPGELMYYESLGLCAVGDAGDFFDSGATRVGGRTPVNTSGGLSSRGHPIAATGIAQIAELTWQLRGQAGARQAGNPRIAIAQNSGGWLEGDPAACCVHILEAVS